MNHPENISQILAGFLASGAEDYWFVDDRVHFSGREDEFFEIFSFNDADFLATEIRVREEFPGWHRWESLKSATEEGPHAHALSALLPLMRISRSAAAEILEGIEMGWSGHPEVLIPTLIHRAGLKIEDIGGCGGFTPEERTGRWYDKRTWDWQGPVEHVPGLLHFPAPRGKRPLAAARIGDGRLGIESEELKMLFVSPVGGGSRVLLPDALQPFLETGVDCLLLQYDEADLPVPEGVRVIRDKGCKWQLAIRHLHPDHLAAYDYIFFWDDDLGIRDFDPLRFAKIMRTNRLDMAQPAIQSPHGLSHAITGHRPCPPPWREQDGEATYPVVGRLTNFVEIMAPVFTREAWREFYGYLDPGNRSGWGYDFIPLARKGIVDAMPVVHTREVRSIHAASEEELRGFLHNQGLFRHIPLDLGWLFEASLSSSVMTSETMEQA